MEPERGSKLKSKVQNFYQNFSNCNFAGKIFEGKFWFRKKAFLGKKALLGKIASFRTL